MANELKRKFTNIIDDDVSIFERNWKTHVVHFNCRPPMKLEDFDPAVLAERNDRGPKTVIDLAKYHARTFKHKKMVLEKRPTELDRVLQIRRKYFDELKSKSTDANHDSEEHVSGEKI